MRNEWIAMGGLLVACAAADEPTWEMVRTALLSHPRLENARWDANAADADRSFAGKRLLPRLEVEVENFAGTGDASGFGNSTLGVWVAGEYRMGDVRQAERRMAATEAGLVALDTLEARRELLTRSRSLWEDWALARWRAELSDSVAIEVRTLVDKARAGRRIGKIEPWEVALAEAELARLEGDKSALAALASSLWLELAAGSVPEPTNGPTPQALSTSAGGGAGLDSLRRSREIERSRAELGLLEAQARPSVTGAVGLLRDQEAGDVGFGARVSLPLPPWNRIGYEAARSRSRTDAAHRAASWEIQQRQRRLVEAERRVQEAKARWQTWIATVLPAKETAKRLVEQAQQASAVDPATTWRVREDYWNARGEALDRLSTLRLAQLQRQNLEGIEP